VARGQYSVWWVTWRGPVHNMVGDVPCLKPSPELALGAELGHLEHIVDVDFREGGQSLPVDVLIPRSLLCGDQLCRLRWVAE